ncbi:hypothetical protein JZ751_000060 [Albula glossodonta]|uniref:Uncharacterized protein n=1 Tax=Albula glossodonta TaxID=121402 RepID=A0A8T2PUR4_9TELE|nr:hypothetical protein JZ751_000060 [Albula glossodonta]
MSDSGGFAGCVILFSLSASVLCCQSQAFQLPRERKFPPALSTKAEVKRDQRFLPSHSAD